MSTVSSSAKTSTPLLSYLSLSAIGYHHRGYSITIRFITITSTMHPHRHQNHLCHQHNHHHCRRQSPSRPGRYHNRRYRLPAAIAGQRHRHHQNHHHQHHHRNHLHHRHQTCCRRGVSTGTRFISQVSLINSWGILTILPP